MLFADVVPSPVGPLHLLATADALVGVHFADPGHPLARSPITEAARAQLDEYFAGARTAFELPLAFAGTPFQREVWRALCDLGFGATESYRALAERIGRPRAVRAVGGANGANPIAIIVPCHRVIGADGSLTGYGGGAERKRWLLAHEGAQLSLPVARPR